MDFICKAGQHFCCLKWNHIKSLSSNNNFSENNPSLVRLQLHKISLNQMGGLRTLWSGIDCGLWHCTQRFLEKKFKAGAERISKLRAILSSYSTDRVINIEETSLFLKLFPHRMYIMRSWGQKMNLWDPHNERWGSYHEILLRKRRWIRHATNCHWWKAKKLPLVSVLYEPYIIPLSKRKRHPTL